MTITSATGRTAIVSRIRNILLQPTAEWRVIEHEPTTVQALFARYAAPLAAITPICSVLGQQLFGVGFGTFHFRPPILSSLVGGLVSYALSLLATFVFGLVIDGLAPSFGGQRDRLKAMKVAVYSATAIWLAGVFGLVPLLAIFTLVGLYSLFLLFRGLPILMHAPQGKTLGYTAVVVLVMLLVQALIAYVVFALAASLGAGAMAHLHSTTTTTTFTTIP